MKHVLIVDDNPMDQRLAGACVQESGLETLFANNGADALTLLESTTVDVILSDLDMPEVNGLELVRSVRLSRPEIPVILMTAQGSEELAAEALRSGASSYVAKRNLNSELSTALKIAANLVQKSRNREAIYSVLDEASWRFTFGNDVDEASNIVRHIQDVLIAMEICDELELLGVGTAILEAVQYAIDYGNLELRASEQVPDIESLRDSRLAEPEFAERKIRLSCNLWQRGAQFVITHDGPAFESEVIDDTLTDEEQRGLVLMRLFTDEVSFDKDGSAIVLTIHADD